MSRTLTLGLVVCAAGGGWAVAHLDPPRSDPKAELMDADRQFAKATAERRLNGWMEFMADDAVRLDLGGTVASVGKAAVRERDARLFADPARHLLWEPTDGGALADGKHGWTTGKSKLVVRAADGGETVAWSGAYVTVWRKGEDGRWRVVLDTGAADPPAKQP